MGKQTCTNCKTRPTTAKICDHCQYLLEQALTSLATWTVPPPPIHRYRTDKAGRRIPGPEPRRQRDTVAAGAQGTVDADRDDADPRHGRLPSSPFDTPHSAATRGGTRSLARELDTPGLHVRNFMSGRDRGQQLRRTPVGRVEHDLADAVRTWIAALHRVHVDAPRTVVTGHLLARGCTWLLWHVHDIAVHADAAQAVAAFTAVAARVEWLVDIPAERVYVGSCWHVQDVGYCTIDDQVEYEAEVECRADMYADPDAAVVVCKRCGHPYDIEEHRAWLSSKVGSALATAAELSGALSRFGFETSMSTLRVWADRGLIVAHGTRMIGPKRSVPVYRVDDALAVAVRVDERAKARRAASA